MVRLLLIFLLTSTLLIAQPVPIKVIKVNPGAKITRGAKSYTVQEVSYLLTETEYKKLIERSAKAEAALELALVQVKKVKDYSEKEIALAKKFQRRAERNAKIRLYIGIVGGIIIPEIKRNIKF